jgi:hypothetical protein
MHTIDILGNIYTAQNIKKFATEMKNELEDSLAQSALLNRSKGIQCNAELDTDWKASSLIYNSLNICLCDYLIR